MGCEKQNLIVEKQHEPMIIAHRGYWNREGGHQNHLESYIAAIEAGFAGAETDVRQTQDGVSVLSHDEFFDGKKISQSNYSDLIGITTLEELLNLVKMVPDFKIVIEIKNADCSKVVELIEKNGVKHSQVTFFSFSQVYCKQLIAMQKGLNVAYLSGDLSPQELYESGYSGMAYNYKYYTKGIWDIGEAKKRGLTVYAWTVNEKKVIQQLKECDYIITDLPITLSGY